MKVYWYGTNGDFHDSTKSVKSAFIKNQKPYIVLKGFLYNKHNTGHYFSKESWRKYAYYIKILPRQRMVSDFW